MSAPDTPTDVDPAIPAISPDPVVADAHAHAHAHGADHVPHVLPLRTYFLTWGALVFLTAVTVGASYVDIGRFNLVLAMFIATVKALTVALVFMHLWFDHKFHALILGSAVIFLTIFIGFTLADTNARGRADAIEGRRPVDPENPFASSMPATPPVPDPAPSGQPAPAASR